MANRDTNVVDRKKFFIERINRAFKYSRRGPLSEVYLRCGDDLRIYWTRNWGETLYELSDNLGYVDWASIDMVDPFAVMEAVGLVVNLCQVDTYEELEDWFYENVRQVCGEVRVFGYMVNRAEALKSCDPIAWREFFLAWLNAGVKSVDELCCDEG